MTPERPIVGWQPPPRCECSHARSEHRSVVTPRRVIVGICLVAGCPCREFADADTRQAAA